MDELEWEHLVDTISEGTCIFFLGPDLARLTTGQTLRSAGVTYLEGKTAGDITRYFPNDELFLFANDRSKSRICRAMGKFYRELGKGTHEVGQLDRKIYQQLSQLPAPLVINGSPDTFLRDQIGEENCEFDFFDLSDPKKGVQPGTVDRPLIYNLTGIFDKEESVILDHEDLFSFLELSLGRGGLPEVLYGHLKQARMLVFLGLRFDKWYVQLFLRMLKADESDKRYEQVSARFKPFSEETSAEILSIVKNKFEITFVDDEIEAFMDKLFTNLPESALRTIKQESGSLAERIRRLVAANQAQDAIDLMKSYFDNRDEEILDSITIQEGRLNRNRDKLNNDVINPAEAEREFNKIHQALLDISKDIKD